MVLIPLLALRLIRGTAVGRAARFKRLRQQTEYVVRVLYADGSGDVNGFRTRDDAMRMVDALRPMLASPDEVGLVGLELMNWRSGEVELKEARSA